MNIVIRAGARALAHIQKNGLSEDDIDLFVGASGGPKCLILYGLDKAVFSHWFRERKKPLHMIGSSIGCYRISALAQQDPVQSIQRFAERYARQSYSDAPDAAEISAEAESILKDFISPDGVAQILAHPFVRVHFIAARGRGLSGHSNKILRAAHFAAACTANCVSRRTLGRFFERYVFHDARSQLDASFFPGFSTKTVPLTKENYHAAVLASGAIPFAMKEVSDIPPAHGSFIDGGIIDYHFDLPFDSMVKGFTLYPHFFDKLVPGWLDKMLPHRKPSPRNYRNVVFVAPSSSFIKSLPSKKVPDRNDVRDYIHDTEGRISLWKEVMRRSEEPAQEFIEAVRNGSISGIVKPIEEIL